MEFFTLVVFVTIGLYVLKATDQARRIRLLGGHLGHYQIEKLMETLTEGYLRCLGESDEERRSQIWSLLAQSEQTLASQFERFAGDFAKVDPAQARVSKWPIAVPVIDRLLPGSTFDARQAFSIHARGIADAAANIAQQTPKDKAFMLSAEMFLMQHTCHWFCRSRAVASARIQLRHETSHAMALASVSPKTREAYRALTGV
ncbi:hypothetical protein [Variovorax sp. ZT4R33]|uniref:hypothetical protein n=1 Tax=Variovorax sp. ZT4R33 TaxID=3443743 RepID=UPI003F445E4F